MNHRTTWTNDDFEEMSWHDVHVHGLRIIENDSDDGTAELVLDIDYILEWIRGDEGFDFVVAQATLQFHEVFGLKLAIDYATPTAGMCAFSLAGIQRERMTYPTGYTSFKWSMDINWPSGSIDFRASGFTQKIHGRSVTQSRQSLTPAQRTAQGAL